MNLKKQTTSDLSLSLGLGPKYVFLGISNLVQFPSIVGVTYFQELLTLWRPNHACRAKLLSPSVNLCYSIVFLMNITICILKSMINYNSNNNNPFPSPTKIFMESSHTLSTSISHVPYTFFVFIVQ